MAGPSGAGATQKALRLARRSLPQHDDLLGKGWHRDADEGPETASAARARVSVAYLPEGFPEDAVVTDADVTFVHGNGSLVYAMAAVFTRPADAARAWAALADEEFAHRFAASVAEDVSLPASFELLGPLMGTSGFLAARGKRNAVTHRATFSRAEQDRVLPVVLDIAAVRADRVLVLVWWAHEGATDAEEFWHHIVDRVSMRCETALAMND